jgi:hypothetical protein
MTVAGKSRCVFDRRVMYRKSFRMSDAATAYAVFTAVAANNIPSRCGRIDATCISVAANSRSSASALSLRA